MLFGTKNVGTKELTEENVLNKITSYDIYSYYLGNFKIGGKMKSPLRAKDNNPSFGIFVHKGNGKLLFKDHLLGGGDCFRFVMQYFNVDYWEALNIINNDMNLGLMSSSATIKVRKEFVRSEFQPKVKERIEIAIKARKWNDTDRLYWTEHHNITMKTLEHFNVTPISHFSIDGRVMQCSPIAYAYTLGKGGYKIYQPNLTVSKGKFMSNLDVRTPWQGSLNLPPKGDLLFITSSFKDVMVLYELGYHAMAPHTEHQLFDDKVYNFYNERWKQIIVFYDHDDAGITHSKKWEEKYGLKWITTDSKLGKDPSDYAKFNSLYKLGELIKSKL